MLNVFVLNLCAPGKGMFADGCCIMRGMQMSNASIFCDECTIFFCLIGA